MREVKLPSGAVLKVYPAPFSEAKALFQALLRELKGVDLKSGESLNTLKNTLFSSFTSDEIEKALEKCLARCTYNSGKGDFKVEAETFQDPKAWGDYVRTCLEVLNENTDPFVNALFGELLSPPPTAESTPKSRATTTT